jgi:hypothetical protein
MTRRLVLSFAGVVAGTVLAMGVANASPATSALDSLRSVGASQGSVEQVHWRRCHRRCWWSHGYWHCRRHCHRWW